MKMDTITFDAEFVNELEKAICLEFGCRLTEIVSLRDSLVKKVIVFILTKEKKYNSRVLAECYQISYLYVPTVVAEMEYLIKTVPVFELKINNIYERIKNILD